MAVRIKLDMESSSVARSIPPQRGGSLHNLGRLVGSGATEIDDLLERLGFLDDDEIPPPEG